jgi:hypothetical protein
MRMKARKFLVLESHSELINGIVVLQPGFGHAAVLHQSQVIGADVPE